MDGRAIEFRAWDVNPETTEGKFIYIDLYTITVEAEWALANLEEFQEYTGLRDKHGTKVYEGDYLVSSGIKAQVHYSVNHARWFWGSDGLTKADCARGEVIGDIYSNPELVGKDAA